MALKLKASSRETYKGYRIKKYGNEYSTVGCIWLFPTIDEVKIYIDEHDSIKPDEKGVMVYIGTVID